MKKLFVILCLLWPGYAFSQVTPPSCTVSGVNPGAASVQAAITTYGDGAVICLAAGTVDYDTQVDPSNNGMGSGNIGVTIRGAGGFVGTCPNATLPQLTSGGCGSAKQTILHSHLSAIIFTGHEAHTNSVVIENIEFTTDSGSTGWPMNNNATITWNRNPGITTKPWIIRYNDFEVNRCDVVRDIQTGTMQGVVYRNRFITHTSDSTTPGCDTALTNSGATNLLAIQIPVTDGGVAPLLWDTPDDFGSADTGGSNHIFFETNYLEAKTLDPGNSSRSDLRFNEFHSTSKADHGFDSAPLGVRIEEIYNNHWFCDKSVKMITYADQRGGTGRVFNNIFDNSSPLGPCTGQINPSIGSYTLSAFKLEECFEIAGWPGAYNSRPVSHQDGWGYTSGSTVAGDSSHENYPGVWAAGHDGFQQDLSPIYFFHNTDNNGGGVGGIMTGDGFNGTCRAQTVSNSSVGSTTTTITASQYIVNGQKALVIYTDLVGGTTPTIADSQGNTWTPIQGATTGGPGFIRLFGWESQITNGGTHGSFDTVTVTTDSSSAARAMDFVEMRGLNTGTHDTNPPVTSTTTQPYVTPTSGTLSQSQEIALGYYGINGPTTFAGFYASDAYNYGSQGIGQECFNCFTEQLVGINGTTGGAATSNVTVGLLWVNKTDGSPASFNLTSDANRTALMGTITFGTASNFSAGPDSPLDQHNADYLAEDREYYVDVPAGGGTFTGITGTGFGTAASIPNGAGGTCTGSVAYWATDLGSWNTSGSGGEGVLFICGVNASAGHWPASLTVGNAGYIPYGYPNNNAVIYGGSGGGSLVFNSQPTNTLVGSNFSPTVTGTLLTGASDSITLSVSTGTCGLSGTLTVNASSGAISFPGVGVTGTPQTGCILKIHDNTNPSTVTDGFSNPFTMLGTMAISVQPSNLNSGAVFAPAVTVTETPSSTDSLTISNNGLCTPASITGITTINLVSGSGTFTGVGETGVSSPTLCNLTITDNTNPAYPPVTSNNFTINASAASHRARRILR